MLIFEVLYSIGFIACCTMLYRHLATAGILEVSHICHIIPRNACSRVHCLASNSQHYHITVSFLTIILHYICPVNKGYDKLGGLN